MTAKCNLNQKCSGKRSTAHTHAYAMIELNATRQDERFSVIHMSTILFTMQSNMSASIPLDASYTERAPRTMPPHRQCARRGRLATVPTTGHNKIMFAIMSEPQHSCYVLPFLRARTIATRFFFGSLQPTRNAAFAPLGTWCCRSLGERRPLLHMHTSQNRPPILLALTERMPGVGKLGK